MCHKAHGTAFGTYYYVKTGDFNWVNDWARTKRELPDNRETELLLQNLA
jgi:hypothetical protein